MDSVGQESEHSLAGSSASGFLLLQDCSQGCQWRLQSSQSSPGAGTVSRSLMWLLVEFGSSWTVELRASASCWLLARSHLQFLAKWPSHQSMREGEWVERERERERERVRERENQQVGNLSFVT